jgi:hypothetical protein
MKALISLALAALLAGCASTATKKMESGENAVGDRMSFTLDGAWNHISSPNMGPAQVWTMEGLPVDQLLIYSGLKDGEVIHAERSDGQRKSFSFRSSMQPDEIVSMFEGMLTRDGSAFKLVKLEPASFGGGKGLRFEYVLVRKVDNVQLSGLGYATVSNGELFALLYTAPRLGFFPRHQARVEQIARTTKIAAKPLAASN